MDALSTLNPLSGAVYLTKGTPNPVKIVQGAIDTGLVKLNQSLIQSPKVNKTDNIYSNNLKLSMINQNFSRHYSLTCQYPQADAYFKKALSSIAKGWFDMV